MMRHVVDSSVISGCSNVAVIVATDAIAGSHSFKAIHQQLVDPHRKPRSNRLGE
ncbi:MAG: hypothetical protein LM517_11555 [Nitrosomonas sp.]|nr:hypothetical protein [Nitrosomonas sp.]